MPRIEQPCALCLCVGLHSPAIPEWPYSPLCREHLAEVLERDQGGPPIAPPPGGYPLSTLVLQ